MNIEDVWLKGAPFTRRNLITIIRSLKEEVEFQCKKNEVIPTGSVAFCVAREVLEEDQKE